MTETTPKTKTAASLSIILTFGLMGIGAVLAAAWFGLGQPSLSAVPAEQSITSALVRQAAQYRSARPSKRLSLEQSLKTLAGRRRQLLMQLIEENPTRFLKATLTIAQRQKLPEFVKLLSEQAVTLSGKLQNVHTDFFDEQRSTDTLTLVGSDQERLTLHFTDDQNHRPDSGAIVRVNGYMLDGDVVIPSSSDSFTILEPAAVNATGIIKVGVILFNFLNDTRQPYSPEVVRRIIFTNANSVNAYYQEASYDSVSLAGATAEPGPRSDVFGWYTLGVNSTGCQPASWSSQAISAAQSAGVDLSPYQYLITASPNVGCSAQGQAFGNVAWSNGYFDVRVIGHELGHLFGVHHANGLVCVAGGALVPLSSNCSESGYNDPFDIMGNWDPPRHFSGYRKNMLGWFQGGDIQDVTTDGTYQLAPIEYTPSPDSLPKTLRLVRQLGYFYLEYRRPFGTFDNFPEANPAVNGISIRIVGNQVGESTLVDANPATGGFSNAPVGLNQTVADPVSGVSITPTFLGPDRATVQIAFTCGRATPIMRVDTQDVQYPRPGQTVHYTATVSNFDSPLCPPSTLTLTPTLPDGWSQDPIPPITDFAPQSSRTVTFALTSAANANDGFYQIPENVRNEDSGVTGTYNAQYNIDTTAPVISFVTNPTNISTLPEVGTVSIIVRSSDGSAAQYLELRINGQLVKNCGMGEMLYCQYIWDVSGLAPGTYFIEGRAADWGNNVGTGQIIAATANIPSGGSGCEDLNHNGRIDVGECEAQEIQ